ncbi:MAG: hypothetical protein B7733_14885 [Myxococcales bacterium FL481]|nr:MAG: hypothetical protein B7733_14885 [Myxococcales bacterium FL481]
MRSHPQLANSIGALALAVAVVPSCAHPGPPCPSGTPREQCLFERAIDPPVNVAGNETVATNPGDPGEPSQVPVLLEPGWERVDELLRDGIDFMQGGSGAVDTITSRWCASPPSPQPGHSGPVWACAITDPPRLRGHELTLEFDRHALFSVTGFGYSSADGRELIRASTERWSAWCQTRSFVELENVGAEEFHRCALSEGPTLIIGRFARDLDADLWQVSLAIIGPG